MFAAAVVAFFSVAVVEGPGAFGLAVARLAMVVAALALGRFALGSAPAAPLAGSAVVPAEVPVLIVNPWSGGGKADRVGLAAACEARGIRVITLEPDRRTVFQLGRGRDRTVGPTSIGHGRRGRLARPSSPASSAPPPATASPWS